MKGGIILVKILFIMLYVMLLVWTEEFLRIYEKAQQLPTEKLEYPITEAQEIGWDTTPLVSLGPCEASLRCQYL